MPLFPLQSHLRFNCGYAVGEVHTGCCLRNRFPSSRNAPSHAVVESGVVLEFLLALIVNAVKPTIVEFPSFLKIKLCKRDATKCVNVRGMGGKCLFIVNWDVNWQKKAKDVFRANSIGSVHFKSLIWICIGRCTLTFSFSPHLIWQHNANEWKRH